MEINWISRNKTGFSVQFQRIHAAETFPCARRKGRFEASLWREGGRQGGEGWEGWGLVVVDCFSYKSGITDASPYQTRGFSGLSVSITEAKEGGRVRDPSSIFCYLHPHHTQTTSSSLGFFSHHLRDKLVEDRVQHYARHLLILHRRASAKLGLNHPKGQPEEFAPVVFIKGECFIPLLSSLPAFHTQCSSLVIRSENHFLALSKIDPPPLKG